MLEVKKARAAKAGSDPTTAQYVDRMERGEGRPADEFFEEMRRKYPLPPEE